MTLFNRKYISLILEGRKTQSRRIHKHTWRVGKVYPLRDDRFGKPKGHITITRKFKQRLGDVSLEDIRKEGYRNLDEFKAAWIKINGSWDPKRLVIVYEFKLEERLIPTRNNRKRTLYKTILNFLKFRFKFKPKLSAVLAVIDGVSVGLTYIVSQGDPSCLKAFICFVLITNCGWLKWSMR